MRPLHVLLFSFLLSAAACTEEEVITFDRPDAGIYFAHGNQDSDGREYYRDSISFSFGTSDIDMVALYAEYFDYLDFGIPMKPLDHSMQTATDHVIRIPVATLGKTRDYPRPVKVVIDDARTNATPGVHYEVDLSAVIVPPGESVATLELRILRAPDLKERAIAIAFTLEENEHFTTYFDTRKNTNLYTVAGEPVSATRFIVTANEFYTEPLYWNIFCAGMPEYGIPPDYFGTWSPHKYAFVNATLGWSDADWLTFGFPISKISMGRFNYAATVVQQALQALADAGTPEREADGSFMQLAGAYLVDYSAHE
ncbi:MAG: DUF4843 domain-containing protein [Odoribacteraceae bacterium]|jgi:hypothetical protein|nr:DUF4843 domain-containing protein [Odoribacteraceae bacterium]